MSQRQIAEALGVTQPAVSQQLKYAPELDDVHPEVLLEAAAPILKAPLRRARVLTSRRVRLGCPASGPQGLRHRPPAACQVRMLTARATIMMAITSEMDD